MGHGSRCNQDLFHLGKDDKAVLFHLIKTQKTQRLDSSMFTHEPLKPQDPSLDNVTVFTLM